MRVSFIIPAHNAEGTLKRTVESILSLNLDCEVIIVENASEDGTYAEAIRIQSKNKDVIVIQSPKGVSLARNAGIEMARGEWLIFVDADDFCLKGYEEVMRRINNQVDIIISAYRKNRKIIAFPVVMDSRIVDEDLQYVKAELIRQPTKYLTVWAKVFKRKFLVDNNLKFKKELTFSEDSEFMIRALMRAKKIMISKIPVYQYCTDSSSAMRTSSLKRIESYIESIIEAEKQFDTADENLKNAFTDYIVAHINLIGVHDVFASDRENSWCERKKQMRKIMQNETIQKYLEKVNIRHNFQALPAVLCRNNLTIGLGGNFLC